MKHNPYKWWRYPSLWWEYRQIHLLNKLFSAGGEVVVGAFERDTLIPMVLGRVGYFEELLNKIVGICDAPAVAGDLDQAARHLMDPALVAAGASAPAFGVAYLAKIKKMVEESFFVPIRQFKAKFPNPSSVSDGEKLVDLLNSASFLSSMISSNRRTLFIFSYKTFPIARNPATGEEIVGLPKTAAVTTVPFDAILDELNTSATTLEESIKVWTQKRLEARKEFMSFVGSRAQVRSAALLNRFQILVILFTFGVSTLFLTLNDPIGLWKRNKDLQSEIERLRAENKMVDSSTSIAPPNKIALPNKTNPKVHPQTAK